MIKTADRCKETTTTTGTGTVTLAGASTQHQAFNSAFSVGDQLMYAIVGQTGTEWEVGIGTLATSSTLSRDTIRSSSNSNAAVSFSAGTKDVFATLSAIDCITTSGGYINDAVTNAITDILTLSHNTSGIPANNIGAGLAFAAETSTTADSPLGGLQYAWSTVTHASRRGKITMTVMDAGTTRTPLTITTDGTRATSTWAGTISNPGPGGLRNEVYGVGAGIALTTNGNDNICFGQNAGLSLTTGTNNIIIGSTAGDALTTGTDNVLIGYDAGGAMVGSDRQYNIAIGSGALHSFNGTSSSAPVVAIGYQALYSLTQANSGNVAIGYQAGYTWFNNQYRNTAVGHKAGLNNTTIGGTFIGFHTGLNTTGGYCVAIGALSLSSANSAAGSISIGYQSQVSFTGSTPNTTIGYLSGYYLTSGSRNTYLGYQTGFESGNNTMSRQTLIGDFALGSSLSDVTCIGVDAKAFATKQVVFHMGNATGDAPIVILSGKSSTSIRQVAALTSTFISSTDASYATRLTIGTYYATTAQTIFTIDSASDQARLGIGGSVTSGNRVSLYTGADAEIGLTIRQNSGSQSGNLLQLTASNGTTELTSFDASGYGFMLPLTFNLAVGAVATTGTNKTLVAIMPRAGKFIKAFIYAKTAPTGAALICDINLNGTSIWASTQANRIQLAAGSNGVSTQTSFDTTTFAESDIVTIDIDQIGATIAGQDITVELLCSVKNK